MSAERSATRKRFNWREFFTDFRGERLRSGDGEEHRYQAFKARFLEEMRQEAERKAQREQRIHEEAMEAAYGPHGQG